ncbi:hypothetical protein ABEF94_009844 [Exophiala dermatitidis]
MRPANACKSCRFHRRKCRVRNPDEPCQRCIDFNLVCSNVVSAPSQRQSVPVKRPLPALRARRTPSSSEPPPPATPAATDYGGEFIEDNKAHNLQNSSNDALFESVELQEELVQLYFAHIHDKHHSLFHEPTTRSQVQDGSLPKVLLYGMMALGARFSNALSLTCMDRRVRGASAAQRAMALFDMTDTSVTTIQASVLLGTICFAESKTEAEAMYYAVANRLAQILNLAHREADNETERQVNLRIWWTLYMIDIWCSTGLHLPRQLQTTDISFIELPVNEALFLGLEPRSLQSGTASSGIWAEMVKLAHIWVDIFDLNQSVILHHETKDPAALEEAVETLLRRLEMWSASLPLHLRKTRSNLEYYTSVGLGSAFAALHLGYHYYTEVLCYQFLAEDEGQGHQQWHHSQHRHPSPDSDKPQTPQSSTTLPQYPPQISRTSTRHEYAEKCKDHARHFCDLLYTCQQLPSAECFYIMVGHMLVVTSTVYIHTLVFSEREDEIAVARTRLERNFQTLMHLQSYWVKLDVSLSRLRAFHNACKVSAEHSFAMDKWMLCFLHEHGLSLPERHMALNLDPTAHFPPTSWKTERNRSASAELTLQDWYSQTFSQNQHQTQDQSQSQDQNQLEQPQPHPEPQPQDQAQVV